MVSPHISKKRGISPENASGAGNAMIDTALSRLFLTGLQHAITTVASMGGVR